ncbi:vesicle transport protein SEC20 isoform X1 [Nerophis lumbriciformis]|uniref:vesicle transport protein SEC20 isoform X1 n=1 Tax=Nerophis lumbriciformis TaxID=546530 RepID=UPI002ADF094A|nr:vesicle transport protein SEC20 isoform X1 [Nerophis lumbriciformis]
MAASSDVHVRICAQEMIKYDLEIKAAVQDIRECSGPQSVLMQLNCHVKDKFNLLRRRIQVSACLTHLSGVLGVVLPCAAVGLQDLEQMAREQDKESDRMSIQAEAESQRRQMLSNQTAWRKANLACKMSMDHMAKDELLREGEGQNVRARKATKESLVGSSSNITESLMSISRMMAEQVKQSEDSISTLATSSRTVQETNEEFKSMTGTIHLGRKLILKYNRRELTDKLLIFLALALFLATVLYILKKRLFPFI